MNNNVQSLWLAGGTALLVTEAARQSQAYALDSILYGQLVADKHQGSRFDDYAQWYRAYRTALESCGWVVPVSNADYQRVPPSAPLRLLADRLEMARPELVGCLESALTRLAARDAQQHLQRFTQRQRGSSMQTVHEFGILLAGPSLLLSSLACGNGADLRDSSLTPDERMPERGRQELHARLEQGGHALSILDLGDISLGGVHGQA